MQTRNPLLNDFAELMTDAMGAAQALGEEARTAWRARADKMIAEMDLVSREEFEAVKAAAAEAREEVEALKARLDALESAAKKPARSRKPAAKSGSTK
jgi:BMFP domain-containing protein YqiC